MFIIDWWNSLELAAQIFYCIAIPASVILIIQTVLTFIGIGDGAEAEAGADADADIDTDISDGADTPDGVFGDDAATETHDFVGIEGLRVLTLRGIIAFFVVFGWVGVVMDSFDIKLYITIPVAFVCGVAMMFLLAYIFRWLMKLRNNGNIDNKNAVGVSGKVYLTVPPSRQGQGKVQIIVQGAFVEREAVTDDTSAIPTGTEIVVVGVSGQTDLIVKRK